MTSHILNAGMQGEVTEYTCYNTVLKRYYDDLLLASYSTNTCVTRSPSMDACVYFRMELYL